MTGILTPSFHIYYSKQLNQLPRSIKIDIWRRLTSRKHPLSLKQASNIHPEVEDLLNKAVENYIKKKKYQKMKGPKGTESISSDCETLLRQENEELYISKQVLEKRIEELLDLQEQYKSREVAMTRSLEESGEKVSQLSDSVAFFKSMIPDTRKAVASAEKSIDMLENKCWHLEDIISAKDRKIIALVDQISSHIRYSDITIEPKIYSSTYERNLWAKRRSESEYDLEVQKKYTFRLTSSIALKKILLSLLIRIIKAVLKFEIGTKYTLKDVNAIAMERGGICLSKEYINFRSLMKWRCAKGHEWQARFPCIKIRKRWCPHCAGNAPYTIEEARQIASSKNGQCLSEKYANSSSPLLWKCAKGHEWYKSLYYVKNRDAWCPECCKITQKLDLARDFALSKRGLCLSEKYINNKTPLKWTCTKGHEWQASFYNVKYHNTWCPYCAKRGLKHNIEFAKSLARERNGECLSENYIDTNQPLLWSCVKRHEWNASLHSIQRGSWCPHCSKYQRENLCHEIVAKYLGPPSKIRRPDFLKTLEYPKGLELDIPYYNHGFAIEVQGEQHEKYIEFFHRGDPNNFIKQQDRDQLKKNLCEENSIYLFYIWYNDKDPEKTIRQELYALGLID